MCSVPWQQSLQHISSALNVPGFGQCPLGWPAMQLPQSLQTTWLASLYLPEDDFPEMFYVIQSLGSGTATAGPQRESARGISSPCSVYGKEHCLAGRQMLHPRHKVKKLKAACGSSAPSRIGPVAWCLHTGRVDRPLAQTIREPPPCFIVGTMHCGLYLSSTLLRTIACFAPQKS